MENIWEILDESECQPWISKPPGCLIGRVPMKYQIMTIEVVPPLLNTRWFINPGLTLHGNNYMGRYGL